MKRLMMIIVFAAMPSPWLWAQAARLPKEKIPQSILDQVRLIQADFVTALSRDCADQGCFPRGCVHAAHELVTLQGDQVLPGLLSEGRTRVSSEPQYLLTAVSCEFAYEEALPKDEVSKLSQRISTKLSSGLLRVTVRAVPMPEGLQSSLEQNPQDLRQKLLAALIQNFRSILLFVLGLISALAVLWAWRRLGRDSKEAELRHMMLKRKLESEAEEAKANARVQPAPAATPPPDEDALLQKRLEQLREPLATHKKLLARTCLEWLEQEDFTALATALLLVSSVAPTHLNLGPEHVLLQEKFRGFARDFQPSREQKRQVIESLEKRLALESQLVSTRSKDLQRFFRYFSARDMARILEAQPLEAQSCLLAIMPFAVLQNVLAALSPESLLALARGFWQDDRVSLRGIESWEEASRQGLEGQPIELSLDSGIGPTLPVDAALILSLLLPRLSESEQQKLWQSGSRPWTRTIFYPGLLRDIPLETARDVLLSCDARSLAHWFSILSAAEQELIWGLLPASYQVQLRASMPEQAEAQRVLEVIRSCGKQLYKRSWQGDGERAQIA